MCVTARKTVTESNASYIIKYVEELLNVEDTRYANEHSGEFLSATVNVLLKLRTVQSSNPPAGKQVKSIVMQQGFTG